MTVLLEIEPCPEPLCSDLVGVLRRRGFADGEVRSIERVGHLRVSSHESFVLVVRFASGGVLRLFVKSTGGGAGGHGGTGHGHWGGIGYEAEVYRQVLTDSPVTTPAYYATLHDGATGLTTLLIEFLEGAWYISKHPEPDRGLAKAARWLGRFHAASEPRVADGSWEFLKRYDGGYYRAWARRTVEYAGEMHQRFPWLRTLAERFGKAADLLLAAPPTVIHGEFYPQNVVCLGETIYPVDWESAAVATGEIDLAALTERWDDTIVAICRRAYEAERWPGGVPADADQRFAAARMFVHFRWLGDIPEVTRNENSLPRYHDLERLGTTLGLLP